MNLKYSGIVVLWSLKAILIVKSVGELNIGTLNILKLLNLNFCPLCKSKRFHFAKIYLYAELCEMIVDKKNYQTIYIIRRNLN